MTFSLDFKIIAQHALNALSTLRQMKKNPKDLDLLNLRRSFYLLRLQKSLLLLLYLIGVLVRMVNLHLMASRECRAAIVICASIRPCSRMAALVSLESNVSEPTWLVWAHWTFVGALRFVVIHHVLLEEDLGAEHFSTDVAGTFLNPMSVSHVIEQSTLGRAQF